MVLLLCAVAFLDCTSFCECFPCLKVWIWGLMNLESSSSGFHHNSHCLKGVHAKLHIVPAVKNQMCEGFPTKRNCLIALEMPLGSPNDETQVQLPGPAFFLARVQMRPRGAPLILPVPQLFG